MTEELPSDIRFTILIGLVARSLADMRWRLRHMVSMNLHMPPDESDSLSIGEMRLMMGELIAKRGGRPDVAEAAHSALESAGALIDDAEFVLREAWFPVTGRDDQWVAMSMTTDITGQAGSRVMTPPELARLGEAIKVATRRLAHVGFLIPGEDGGYFFADSLEENMRGARGDFS